MRQVPPSGGAEAVHGDSAAIEADEAVPADGFELPRQALAYGIVDHLFHASAICSSSSFTGQGDFAHLLAFSGQLLGCLDLQVELCPGAEWDQLSGSIAVFDHVAAKGHFVDGGVGLVTMPGRPRQRALGPLRSWLVTL